MSNVYTELSIYDMPYLLWPEYFGINSTIDAYISTASRVKVVSLIMLLLGGKMSIFDTAECILIVKLAKSARLLE